MAKVLVVEDDRFLLNAYRVKLAKAGFEVQLAMDGEEALTALQTFFPDVILLDLVMPKKDGFMTLTEIKADPKLKVIPVIITSNLGQNEDVSRVMKLGAAGYMIKSDVGIEEIVTKLQEVIGLNPVAQAAAVLPSPAPQADATPSTAVETPASTAEPAVSTVPAA